MSNHPHTSALTPLDVEAGEHAALHLRLLGGPGLNVLEVVTGQPRMRRLPLRPQALRLLAALCLDGPCQRLSVADLLWETSSARSLHNLRMTLHDLRRALGPHADWLQTEGSTLGVDLSRCRVDALWRDDRRGAALVEAWTGPLMDGHRTGGPEGGLDWLRRTEERLLSRHLRHLHREARTAPPPLGSVLLPPALSLRGRDAELGWLRGASHSARVSGSVAGGAGLHARRTRPL